MKNFKLFKSGFCEKLKLLLIPIGLLIGSLTMQVWAYKVYVCTQYYTDYNNNSGRPVLHVTGFNSDSQMDKLSQNWWVCEVGNCEGTATVKRYYDANSYNTEFQVTVSPSNNVIFATATNAGNVKSPREYDGKTYIYWKVSGDNIPSWWKDDDRQCIQLRKNDNTVTGYVEGESIGENFYRYLVPEGKYVNAELKRYSYADYSGPFAFNASSSYNLIYDFKNGGHYANWSTDYFARSAYIYMDNTASDWSTISDHNLLMIGRDGYSNTYDLNSISNTKLLYKDNFSFNDYTQMYLLHDDATWGESTTQSPGYRISGADYHTGIFVYMMDGGDSKNYHLYTPDGAGQGASYSSVSHSTAGSYGDLLHSTQTVNTVAKTTGSYSSANSKAEITLSSYKLNSATTSTTSTATLATSESTDNITAVKTATTTLTCSNTIADGYQFDGWWTAANDGTRLQSANSYSYATTGANTVYARFSAKSYTITLNDNGGSGGDGTHSVTFDVAVGNLTNKPTKTNMAFCGYETESHIKIFNADKTPVSGVEGYTDGSGNWIKADNVTLYAIWEDKWSINGNAGDDGVEDAMGDWDVFNSLPYISGTTYRGAISLDSKTTYSFKVVDRVNNAWYGKESTSFTRGGSSVSGFTSGQGDTYNLSLTTDVAGSYTFEWNSASTGTLSVTFPDAHTITFAIGDLDGSNSPIGATATPSFSSGDYVLDATAVTFTKGTTKEGYDWKGWYPNADGTGDAWSTADANWLSAASTRSANIEVYACYTYRTYTISYRDQGNDPYSGDNTDGVPSGTGTPTSYTYNTGTDLVDGTKTSFVFAGWYTNSECTEGPITSIAASITGDQILYAKWIPAADYAADCWDGNTFKCGDGTEFNTPKTAPSATWNGATWGNDVSPTIATQVVIPEGMAMTIPTGTTAFAKEVVLSDGATLTVANGAALIVASMIDKEGGLTSASDLTLSAGTSVTGNAALIWGKEGTTPGAASVGFYSKSHGQAGSSASVNQYIGVPVVTNTSAFGDAWVCHIKYEDNIAVWELHEGTMQPWVGYDLILNTTGSGGSCIMSGTLENNSDKPLNLVYQGDRTENLIANSWPAPIKISAFQNSDFTNAEPSIYIFNATSPDAQAKDETMHMGSYSAFTAGTAPDVIPSMQSFSVIATSSSPSINLNYKRLVYAPAVSGFTNQPNYAPKRTAINEMTSLKINICDAQGWGDELKLFENSTDFSYEFESGYDAHRLDGSSKAPHLYGLADDGSELAINCVPTFDNLPVGFKASAKDKEYTMSFKYDGEDELVLKDLKNNIETLINNESRYTFTSTSTDDDLRFVVIKKAPQIATKVENTTSNEETKVQKILHNGLLYIVRDGRIYNAEGALVK